MNFTPTAISLMMTCAASVAFAAAAPEAKSIGGLDLSKVQTGWGEVKANVSIGGKPLSIGGVKYAEGLGMHASGAMAILLDGKGQEFRGLVGVDDEVPAGSGSVEFVVMGDGKELWKSGVMKSGEAAKPVKVSLVGVRKLELLVHDGGDGIGNDHADWVDAVIVGEHQQIRSVFAGVEKTFKHPDRIRYDGHCVTIDGVDTFVYSATFHYFRTPKELWRDRFQKVKDAGFNTVETYVPWNWHEREMPKGLKDFSQVDLSEIKEWLKMAHEEFGLYTIVRPGPFICAEWAGGAYPRWLAKFGPGTGKEEWLRSADQAHIDWSVHWYDAVCPLFAKEQITNKPKGSKGIIMVQIENEYNHHGTANKDKVLVALYEAVKKNGVDVPIFTCVTNETRGSKHPVLSQVFDCDNYYVGLNAAPSCAQRMASLRKQQPDAPGFVTELQCGWFSTVNGGMSDDHYSDARHFQAINYMSILGGATGLDPYVFVGGTHFDNWGARGMTTSYDYNAGIHESGALGEKFYVAKGVSQFVEENKAALLRSEGGPCELQGAPDNVFGGVRVGPDGTKFVFLTNTDPKKPVQGKLTVVPGKIAKPKEPIYNINQHGEKVLIQTVEEESHTGQIPSFELEYALSDLGTKVLVIPPGKSVAEGVWYPKEQKRAQAANVEIKPIRIASVLKAEEPLTAEWKPLKEGVSLPEIGVSDHRYVMYRAKVQLGAEEVAKLNQLLIRSFSRDIINAQVNGKVAKRTAPSDAYAASAHRDASKSHQRLGAEQYDNAFEVQSLLKAGENEIVMVYENIGHEHGYIPMEELSGIANALLADANKEVRKPLSLQVAKDLGGIAKGWIKPEAKVSGWEKVALDTQVAIAKKGKIKFTDETQTGLLTWYRMEFELPALEKNVWVPWMLRLQASGNGNMWLNGHNIGRHYETGPQREFYLPECWLNVGPGKKNVLVMGLRQTMHGAKIQAAEIAPYPNAAVVVEPVKTKSKR